MNIGIRIFFGWSVAFAFALATLGAAPVAAMPLDAECSMRCVDVSGDGEFVAAGWGSNVSVFRRGRANPMWTYETTGLVDVVVLSDDGQKLAVAFNDLLPSHGGSGRGHVLFFPDTASASPAWEFTTDFPIYGLGRRGLAMSRDGSMIVVGTHKVPEPVGTLYRFDTANPMPVEVYDYPGSIMTVTISGNAEWFAAGTYWWSMRVYNVATGTYCSAELGDPFYAVALDRDGQVAAAGHGWAGQVDLYGVAASGECPLLWWASTDSTNATLAMDDLGTLFAASEYPNPWTEEKGVRVFATSGGGQNWSYPTADEIKTIDMARDGSVMIFGGMAGDVYVMPTSGAAPAATQFIGETIAEVAMSADGSYAAAASYAGFLYMFDTSAGGLSIEGIYKTPCKTAVCHVQSRKPAKSQTLVVGGQAAAAHLMQHPADTLGACAVPTGP